jgi:LytS/YehU family sensor histidine kinase
LRKFFSIAFKSTAAYATAQVVTGIEGGVIAAYLVVIQGMTTPEAVALVTAGMLPMMLLQTVISYYIISRYVHGKKGSDSQSTNLEIPGSDTNITNS